MSKKSNPPSSNISEFLQFIESSLKDYAYCFERVNLLDKLTQDYLHKLELEDLSYAERAKIATQLRRCRRERRQCKDTAEILEPIVAFAESDKGAALLNYTRELLGKTRKVEDCHKHRVYIPKVLEQEVVK